MNECILIAACGSSCCYRYMSTDLFQLEHFGHLSHQPLAPAYFIALSFFFKSGANYAVHSTTLPQLRNNSELQEIALFSA